MKTNASSITSACRINQCICPYEVGTKITYGVSNLQLSMYTLHKRGQQFFLFYGNEIHACATVKDHIEDKIFKTCILYHMTYTTIEAPLYQPLRFILNFIVIEV